MVPSNKQADPIPVEQQDANPKKAGEQALRTHDVRTGQENLQRFLVVHGQTGKASSDDGTSMSDEKTSSSKSDECKMTVRQSIEQFVDELKLLLLSNTEPILDNTLHLDVLIASENTRKPWLNLRLLTNYDPLAAIVNELSNMKTPFEGYQWQAVIDDGWHRTAASVRHAPDNAKKVSIIFVGSRSQDGFMPSPQSRRKLEKLGFSVSVGHVSTGAQRGGGCTFFALSAVKIMTKSSGIDNLHKQLLATPPNPDGSDDDGNVIHQINIDEFSLEPAFFKHATSMKLINKYLKGKSAEFISKLDFIQF